MTIYALPLAVILVPALTVALGLVLGVEGPGRRALYAAAITSAAFVFMVVALVPSNGWAASSASVALSRAGLLANLVAGALGVVSAIALVLQGGKRYVKQRLGGLRR